VIGVEYTSHAINGTFLHRLRLGEMKDDDLIPRNAWLPAQAQNVSALVRDTGADVLDRHAKLNHARTRMRKLLWAREVWPRYMRRLIRGTTHPPL